MLIYWFLPMILFLGIVTSYEDVKFGKIRNKWILFAIIYGIIVNIVLFSLGYYNLEYLIKFLINSLISLVVGFIIWYANLWTAGDAKLFFAYSLLLPLNIYKFNNFKFFPSANILINTFIPIALIFTVFILIKIDNKAKVLHLIKSLQFKKIIRLALFLFTLTWLLDFMLLFLNIQDNYLIFFLTFLLFLIFEKILNTKIVLPLLFISIMRIIFDQKILLPETWFNFLFMLVIFIILRFFLLNASFNAFSKEIKIKDLKKGMIPAEMIFKHGKILKKVRLVSSPFLYEFQSKNKKYLFENKPEGLTNSDIKKIKKVKLPFKYIRVHQTVGFALFIFIGVLLTFIFHGNIFTTLKVLFGK